MGAPLPVAGDTVSHYQILHHIDGGGMGVVYAARDLRLGRKVAVKFLSSELCANADAIKRFEDEARLASSLDHPNICTVHDVGRVTHGDGTVQHFLVMELLQGSTLKEVLASQILSLAQVLDYAIHIATGLEAAHGGGVIHRDIKPANLFVTTSGVIKILDFGLAKLAQPRGSRGPSAAIHMEPTTRPLTSAGVAIGTAAYMSPEQARGEHVDHRTDVFSFGAVLYEMLTGGQPFAAQTPALVFDAILHRSPSPPSTAHAAVPRELDILILKALHKNREQRYQTVREVRSDLQDVKRQIEMALRVPDRSPPSGRRWLWATAIAVAVMLLLLLKPGFQSESGVAIGPGGRPAVAVLAFDVTPAGADVAWLRQGLPIMLVTGLAQTPGLDVISGERIDEVTISVDREVASSDKPRVLEVARRAGAGALVTGRVFALGTDLRIDAQVQDVRSGRVTGAETVTGREVFALADELTRRLHRMLQVPRPADPRAIRDLTSGSVQAYHHYVDGVEARRNLREVDARVAFEQAIGVDPNFALVYFPLAEVCERLGDLHAAEKYRHEGRTHLARLPERQQLFWGADEARRDGDFRRAVDLLETLISRYPDQEDAYLQLAIISARELADNARALTAVERGVIALPMSAALRNDYGYRLLWVGRLPEAMKQFETYAQLRPVEPNPYDSLGEAYLVAAEPQRALELYARALALDPSFAGSHRGRAWAFGMLGQFDDVLAELSKLRAATAAGHFPWQETHFLSAFVLSRVGRYVEAAQEISAGVARAESVNDRTNLVWFHVLDGTIALERGRLTDAERAARRGVASLEGIADAGLRRVRAVYALALTGVVEARAGRHDAARAHLATVKQMHEPAARREAWPVRLLEAEIALAVGAAAEAANLFAAAEPSTKMWFSVGEYASAFANAWSLRDGFARARYAHGDVDGAIDAYRRLTAIDLGQKSTAMLEPRHVLALARLHHRAGDLAAARHEYQRFLNLWSNADATAPELLEARRALAPSAP